VDKFIAAIEHVADNLSRSDFAGTISRIDSFFTDADALLKGDVRQMVQELRQTADNLERISQRAKSDPSAILFGQPPPQLPPSNSGGSR
jgi:hypothetical protein